MNDYVSWLRSKVGNDMVIMVGCGVLIEQGGRLLLQKRRDNGCWALRGG